MKKYLPHISAFLLTFVLIFAVSGFLFPQTTHAGFWDVVECTIKPIDCALRNLVLFISSTLLQLVSLLTGLSAIVLNGVVYYTVVKVSENYASLTGINSAWSTVRDLANMGFIFILLYAAIQTILGIGSDTKKLIVNVIVVAILINFSLFFTKIVIDVSNILALLFYDAIVPGALNATATLSLQQAGLSNAFMQHLSLQSIYQATNAVNITFSSIITIGVMGSIMLLIAAFVFFAAAIMFIVRYVILILVLILSPIAFMAFVLPALKEYGDKWKDALIGQAFFAPIYFMLIWVALRVLGGVNGSGGITGAVRTSFGVDSTNAALSGLALTEKGVSLSGGAFGMFINFIIVIVFLIASLIIAKKWADKAGSGATGLTKWAMGAAVGGVGLTTRHTLGRAGTALSESEILKKGATSQNKYIRAFGIDKLSRGTLATGKKAGEANFDMRGTALGGKLEAGKAGGKGGFTQFKKDQAEAAEKRAKSYGPSDEVIDQAEQAVKRAGTDEERGTAQARLDQLKGVSKKEAPERIREVLASDPIIKEKERVERDLKDKQKQIAETTLPQLKAQREQELATIKTVLEAATNAAETRTTEIRDRYKEGIKGAARERKESYARVMENSYWAIARGYNLAAAAQIRRGKSKEKKLVEAFKDITKDEEPETETSETSPSTPTPPAGGTPPTS